MSLYAALAADGRVEPLRLDRPAPYAGRLPVPATGAVSAIITHRLPDSAIESVAWKVGTISGERDAWAFGFDPATLVGVWIGRPTGAAMGGASADAMPVLKRVMRINRAAPRVAPAATSPLGFAAIPNADPLRLLFPMRDAVIEGDGTIDLEASDVRQSLHFLVDGVPLETAGALREAPWIPPVVGFYYVRVVDAGGRSVDAPSRIADPAPP